MTKKSNLEPHYVIGVLKMKNKKSIKKKILKWILVVLLVGFVWMIVNLINIRHEQKIEYNGYIETYSEKRSEIEDQLEDINKFQKEERNNEDELYNLVKEYRDQIEETDDNEVFRKVFDKVFPTETFYKTSREESFVKIYALLEMYPEIKEYGKINEVMFTLTKTITNLRTVVDMYNEDVDEYIDIIDTINNCDYVKYNDRYRVDKNNYQYYYVD